VKQKRDYLTGRSSASWLYMSRLSALKEYAFMKALHSHGFPTPTPVDQNRHVVLMSVAKVRDLLNKHLFK
jgi:RIO kinase 2